MADTETRRRRSMDTKRREIKTEIRIELKRPLPDHLQIGTLKRKNLALKDAMLALERSSDLSAAGRAG